MLSAIERDDIARSLAESARAGGDVLACFRSDACRRALKPDGSPVSEADLAAEAEIQGRLARAFPRWPVISEENAASHARSCGDLFLLVDPLDGTRAFLAGQPDFCVLIALVEKGTPVAGAIHAPASGASWWAGATAMHARDHAFAEAVPLLARPPRAGGRIAIVSSMHGEGASSSLCRQFAVESVRRENSALKFARLAEGEADLYPRLGRTMQWDVAAGDALLRALGGGVFDAAGRPLQYGAGAQGWANPDFLALRRKEDLPPRGFSLRAPDPA